MKLSQRLAFLLLALCACGLGAVAIRSILHAETQTLRNFHQAHKIIHQAQESALRNWLLDWKDELLLALEAENPDSSEKLSSFVALSPTVDFAFLYSGKGEVLFSEEAPENARDLVALFLDSEPWNQKLPENGSFVPPENPPPPLLQYGWTPLRLLPDTPLHIVGWIRNASSGEILACDLPLPALFQALQASFAEQLPENYTFSLRDSGTGESVYLASPHTKTDATKLWNSPKTPPVYSSLEPLLPDCRLALCTVPILSGMQISSSFSVLAGCALVLFLLIALCLLLIQAHRQLRESFQKTCFLSTVSHELRTPLTGIRMHAELLQENRLPDAATREHCLNRILRETGRLSRLVNSLLDFSRLEQNQRSYHCEPLALQELLEMLQKECGEILSPAGMRLSRCPLPPELSVDSCSVLVDCDALHEIFLNLVENAAKYAASGKELCVRCSLRSTRSSKFRPALLAVDFLDSGPGIPRRCRRKIFRRFFRLDNSTHAATRGTGLGLSIARALARGMKGDLFCSARPGGGACFTLLLPLTPAPELPCPPES